ncbi:fibronectin type III domain-containing protein [Flavobacterium ginsengiterrae]
MIKKLHLYLLLLCSLIGLGSHAQTFPIRITTQLTQPSPIYLSNYADANTVNSPIKIQLVLNDLTISNRQVRLKIYFQGNGIAFSTNDFVVGAKPLYLEGGFPLQLTNVDLAPYFEYQNLLGLTPNQYAQPLPEGVYNIYVEVYDFATGRKLSSKTGTTTIIFQNEPPFLNLPLNNVSIMQQNIQNIVFGWTPRSINVSNVEYEFSIVEIWDKYTPVQNAFAYSPPLYTTTTRNTSLQYGINEPQLIPGKKYAWRVKAKALLGAEEIGVFKNNGYSEIFAFNYEVFCTAPLAINTEGISENQAKVTWSGSLDNYDYQVKYREKNSGTEWYDLVTPRETVTISNLKPNTTYEYTVGASCDVGKYTHSTIKEFTTLVRDEIAFQGCGIKPDPNDLVNQKPLPELFPNDVIAAGDFPIVVLHATGSNGTFSGDGYVTLPFLEKFRKLIDAADALGGDKVNIGQFSRIRITFDNIGLNTDFKLISGEIIAGYDPNWGGILNGDKLVDDINDLVDEYDPIMESIFGPKPTKEEKENADVSMDEEEDIESNNPNPPVVIPVEYNPIDIVETDETIPSPDPIMEESIPQHSNTNNNSNISTPSTGTPTENGYYIEYKGQKYYTGGKIKIPYNRIMYATFEMKEVPTDAKVTFTIHEPGKKEMWRGYDSSNSKSSLPIEDITVKNNLRIHDLQSEATSIDGQPKVRVEVEKIVEKFTQINLTATDIKYPKRIANSTQTLYYVDTPSRKNYKDTELQVKLSQNDINKIPEENIKWLIDSKANDYKDGITKFKYTAIDEVGNTTFTNIAGYPTLTKKDVKINWVKEERKDASFMPLPVTNVVTQFNDKLIKPFESITKRLDKWTGSKPEDKENFKIEIKSIKIKGEAYNEEDSGSRHYFKTLKGSLNGGISLKGEFFGYPPFLAPLNIKNVTKVGFFISPKVEVNIVGARLMRTIGESNKKTKDNFLIEGNIKGCIEVGVKAELLVAKDDIEFSVRGTGEGCVSGKRVFNFTTNKWDGGFYIDPVKLAVKAKIKSKGSFKITLVDFDQSFTITDKIELKSDDE